MAVDEARAMGDAFRALFKLDPWAGWIWPPRLSSVKIYAIGCKRRAL